MKKEFFAQETPARIRRTAQQRGRLHEVKSRERLEKAVRFLWGEQPRGRDLEAGEAVLIDLSGCNLLPATLHKAALRGERFGTLHEANRWYGRNPRLAGHLRLPQPSTQEEARAVALERRKGPYKERNRMFRQLGPPFLGFSYRGLMESTTHPHIFQFHRGLNAVELLAYTGTARTNFRVSAYQELGPVGRVGGEFRGRVPSRSKGVADYDAGVRHVPMRWNADRYVIGYSLEGVGSAGLGDEPAHRPAEEAKEVRIGPTRGNYVATPHVWREQDIAVFYHLATSEYGRGNKVPLQASVLPIPSRQSALFNHRLRHNVIVRDPTIEAPERHLHDEERSMLYSIAVRLFGPKETLMWGPQRDGPIREYIPG